MNAEIQSKLDHLMEREISLEWGLPTWKKPSAACLSSRVAYGLEITKERLGRALKQLGFSFVTLDLAGYRTGSMNETLAEVSPRHQYPSKPEFRRLL